MGEGGSINDVTTRGRTVFLFSIFCGLEEAVSHSWFIYCGTEAYAFKDLPAVCSYTHVDSFLFDGHLERILTERDGRVNDR